MNGRFYDKEEKGSLTIEAIISFTVFLMVSFLMLQLVKLTMISLVMNSCTQETAKQIATSSYPLVMVNGFIDDTGKKIEGLGEVSTSVDNIIQSSSANSALSSVMGVDSGSTGSASALFTKLADIANQGVMNVFSQLKGRAGLYITAKIMDSYLDASGMAFDKDKVVFRLVKLPQAENEYKYKKQYTVEGEKNDLIMKASSESNGFDGDYNRDDVVICAEYDYQIVLPLLPAISLTLRSTAVEHAWLTGCSSSIDREEGFFSKIFDNEVYVTTGGSGEKYHKKGCRMMTLGGYGYTPTAMNLSVAIASGLEPCGTCRP